MTDKPVEFTMEQLWEMQDEARAADSGLCDSYEERTFDPPLPPSMAGTGVHSLTCGCSSEVGWIEPSQVCRHCGRHPEVH